MIMHIVAFKFVEGISWRDPRAEAAERISRRHPEYIPEIRRWTAARNISQRPAAYDFAVIGHFADREALGRYMVHPDHQRGVEAWQAISTWIVVDLEVDADRAGLGSDASDQGPGLVAEHG
jgi:hypothetical protein